MDGVYKNFVHSKIVMAVKSCENEMQRYLGGWPAYSEAGRQENEWCLAQAKRYEVVFSALKLAMLTGEVLFGKEGE